MTATALVFQNTQFDIVDRDNQPWLRSLQIAKALGYTDDKSIHRIYNRHSSEFTSGMTGVVKLTTPSGMQDVRIFSLRGDHLLGMFARTDKAKEFRKWVLDVLDGVVKSAPAPAPALEPEVKALPPARTFTRVEWNAIQAMIRAKVKSFPPGIDALMGFRLLASIKKKFGVAPDCVPRKHFSQVLTHIAQYNVEDRLGKRLRKDFSKSE